LGRDPIGERGGANLYGFCGNDAVNEIDLFGFVLAPNPMVLVDFTKITRTIIVGGGSRSLPRVGRGGIGLALIAWWFFLQDIQNQMADAWGIPRPNSEDGLIGFPYSEKAFKLAAHIYDVTVTQETMEDHRMRIDTRIKPGKIFHRVADYRDNETGCCFIWDSLKLGNWKEHDKFTAKLFQPDYELVVVAPDGDNARYDGGYRYPGPVTTVVEAKTGRKWAASPKSRWSPVQDSIYWSDMYQFARQRRVATKCKLKYRIYFSNRTGAKAYKDMHPNQSRLFEYIQK
jgi:hypothetical protein